ncbi:MAG: ATP phosphoribosyltransferase [Defluviitaleaceae bacterium]|nr:ATP phosphoribosyltransferase [Defluviitaleaceae bacterium]
MRPYLTFAIAKGRLAAYAVDALTAAGASCEEMRGKSRKLIFYDEENKYRFFLAKASDVPTYVEHGAADIGIVGSDTLTEEQRDLYEVADLGFGKCSIVAAGPPEAEKLYRSGNNIRVTTKYPGIASDFFNRMRRQTIEIIKLNGSVELGPKAGLSDLIVDIVETGDTLRENGLVIFDEICQVSARMVVNRVSIKMESERINELIKKLKAEG